ncbi:MAG: poly(ethylene terephthalate) hydrolase family protein [Niveispirillum sp.]|uniref:poly(ethylene terephthalate) hydrolase family protein n=1 Tax=Niveispirillum sp. TaxID=1917217 RepID=UPI004036F58B
MVLALSTATAVLAQQGSSSSPIPGSRPNIPPEILAQMQREEAAYQAMPDTPGSGPYPALKEEDRSLPEHTVYRPADVASLGKVRLPIVVWGNGGCAGDGAGQRLHLAEIASHGYLVIANGGIKSGPGTTPIPRPRTPPPEQAAGFVPPPPESSAEQLTQAINWAIAENARQGSAYFGKLDTNAVAVSGWSCGGVQALTIATRDPRVKTAVIHNSGLFPDGQARMRGMELTKSELAKLGSPVIYILGGPTDIAYANGMDDFVRIGGVPAAVANLAVGHTGTFFQPNGGKAAQVALAWLDWRLKGRREGAAWFVGTKCKLCTDAEWKIEVKGL